MNVKRIFTIDLGHKLTTGGRLFHSLPDASPMVTSEFYHRRNNLVRVPAFVRYLLLNSTTAMEFYGFNEIFSPIFGQNHKLDPYWCYVDDSFRARPFTVLNGCPKDCSFASFGGQLYICGGSTLDIHVMNMISYDTEFMLYQIRKLLNDEINKYLTQHNGTLKSLLASDSNRVKRFDCQKFVNSLSENNQKGKIVVAELDEDASNDSQTYWETCPSMSKGRRRAHLLHLGDKLFAIGGNNDGKRTSLIEVFDQGVWTPLFTENPPDIDPSFLVSAAFEDANTILIGSKGSFYLLDLIDVGNERVEGCWKKLSGECPSKLLLGFFKQPGIVTKKRYAVWYVDSDSCIYGFDLFSYKYFRVTLIDKIFGRAASPRISKLIDLGEGILCLIFTGQEKYRSTDVHGVEHEFYDQHCVTFEMNFDGLLQIEANMSFPRIDLEMSVISHYKCYAPGEPGKVGPPYTPPGKTSEVGPAFALDIHIPDKKKVPV